MPISKENILHRSLTRDLTIWLSLALSLLLIVVGSAAYIYYTYRFSTELENRANLLSDEIAQVLSRPAWNLDEEAARHIAMAYLHSDIMAGMRLVINPDTVVLDKIPETLWPDTFQKSRTIFYNTQRDNVPVGTLDVWFSRDEIHAMQARLIRIAGITVFFSILLLVLGMQFLMSRLLQGPMHNLLQSVRSIAAGNYDNVIKPVPQHDINAIITEVNFMAARIAEHTNRLEEEIQERKQAEKDREQLQNQLIQARKMESIGTLAGGVAHDFNNQLHVIMGNIELLLQNKPADHPDRKRLDAIAKSIDRASQLVRQLLLFSRKTEAVKQPVYLNREVLETVALMERTIPKMIRLETDLDKAAWPIHADPLQVEQVLMNLAGNASDAMPNGGRLLIETKNMLIDEDFARNQLDALPGPYVLLAVSDTGCGMEPEITERIFDPFFTTKEVGKGTGLGLATIYGIVRAHNGYIRCYSAPGQGTTFKVFWPAMPEFDMADKTSDPAVTTPTAGSETLLVVDDEPKIRELTKESLESLGYSVHVAESGEEALDIYQSQGRDIDLVLLDINMPGMGGNKCMEALLRLDPTVSILIASGYTANAPGREVSAAGARGFIGKPYQVRELASRIRKILDENPTPRD